MVDITAKLFWYRTKEWYQNMADKLNDVVYTDDSKETVDVVNLLLLGWILLGLIVYIIGTVIATQLRKRKATFPSREAEISDGKPEPTQHVSCASEVKSAVPEIFEEPEKIQKTFVPPTCTGDEPEVVEWIQSIFSWIYENRIVSPIIDAWLSALNARTRLLSTEHGILIDFKDVVQTSKPLQIQEAIETCSSKGDLNLLCHTAIDDVAFDITVTQVKEKEKTVIPFLLNAKRISGKINIECFPEDLSFIAKFSERPHIELSAEPSNSLEAAEEVAQALNDVVCEISSEAIASAIVDDLKFSCYPECPRFVLKTVASEEEDFESAENEAEEKLLVKIIKATNLGGTEGCLQPYCVVEMDEPPQRFETRALEEKANPFWVESFTFTVKDVSAELLFEIYDKGKPSNENFLGLGIVSVDELTKDPSQRQIIPLQSRPLEDDNVTGTLTTEFLFLNQIAPVSDTTHLAQKTVASDGKTIETNSRVTAGGTVITTTTIKRTKEESCDRPEAISNLNANPLVEPLLTTVHEIPEELQKKNEQTICLTSLQGLNGNINQNNTHIEVTTNHVNTKNDSNIQYLDKEEHSDMNKQNGYVTMIETSVVISKQESPKNDPKNVPVIVPLHSIDALKLAYSPVHVHEQKLSAENNDNLHNCNDTKQNSVPQLNGITKMHEMNENIEITFDSSNDSDHYDCDVISTLPPIDESVEFSSSTKSLENMDGEADLPGTALKEIEKLSKPNSTSKSTLIIHSVQRADSSVSESLEASPASHISKDSRTSYSESVPSSPSQEKSGDDRSRSKEKRSVFGSLRRRLSFRKTRSKSAENRSESSNYSQGSSRSASTDRLKFLRGQKPSPIKGKFIGNNLAVPASTRSSLSEVSGISASSSRTYINENSTLVIETNENGIIKRYLIPNSLAHRSKWKKRGTKLHIYNDHVFVAKHLSGSTICKVCQKYLTRRPGKQGYECRGCSLQCHKRCHVKVESFCSNSSINSMEVEYIHDPKGATPKSV